ncbi:hypothetical protein ACWDMZ_30950, partial [Streptomyces sp. NPDC000994]
MAQDTAQQAPTAPATPARALLPQLLPALAVGVGSSLLFLLVSGLAEQLQAVLWESLPDALGSGPGNAEEGREDGAGQHQRGVDLVGDH